MRKGAKEKGVEVGGGRERWNLGRTYPIRTSKGWE